MIVTRVRTDSFKPREFNSFGTALTRARNKEKLTKAQLAQAIGIHVNRIGKIERNEEPITIDIFFEIVRRLPGLVDAPFIYNGIINEYWVDAS